MAIYNRSRIGSELAVLKKFEIIQKFINFQIHQYYLILYAKESYVQKAHSAMKQMRSKRFIKTIVSMLSTQEYFKYRGHYNMFNSRGSV